MKVTNEQKWQLVCAVTPAVVARLSEKDGPRIAEAVTAVVEATVRKWESSNGKRG